MRPGRWRPRRRRPMRSRGAWGRHKATRRDCRRKGDYEKAFHGRLDAVVTPKAGMAHDDGRGRTHR